MAISTLCPNCGATLQFDDPQAHKQGSCPNCGATFTIPAAASGGDYAGAAPTSGPGQSYGGPTGNPEQPYSGLASAPGQPYGGPASAPGQPYMGQGYGAPDNPYAAGHAAPGYGYGAPGGYYAPHRGGMVLTLGILGLMLCFILGVFAWVMGSGDLQKMRAGQMDPRGYGTTQAGMICGMIATILAGIGFVFAILMILAEAL